MIPGQHLANSSRDCGVASPEHQTARRCRSRSAHSVSRAYTFIESRFVNLVQMRAQQATGIQVPLCRAAFADVFGLSWRALAGPETPGIRLHRRVNANEESDAHRADCDSTSTKISGWLAGGMRQNLEQACEIILTLAR